MTATKAESKKETLKEQIARLDAELGEISIEEDLEAYKKKADELGRAWRAYCNERVLVKLPRPRGDEDRTLTVIWNGTKYSIDRRVASKEGVMVPRGVALIIEQSEEQAGDADDFIKELQDEYETNAARLTI